MFDALRFPIVSINARTIGHADTDGSRHVPKTFGVVPAGSTYVLTSNGGSGDAYWAPGGAGAGTVTSVGLSMPGAVFTVTASPVTAAGVIAVALNSQAANLAFASPDGVSGLPTFRTLVTADISGLAAALAGKASTSHAATHYAGGSDQIAGQSLQGLRTNDVPLFQGVTIATTANFPLTITLTDSSSFSAPVKMRNPSLPTGGQFSMEFGTADSAYNSGHFGFINAGGAGSSGNYLTFGLWGANGLMKLYGTGVLEVPAIGTGFVRAASGVLSASALVAGDIPSLDASKITTGTFGSARLGSGTADATKFLRGDQSWQTLNTAAVPELTNLYYTDARARAAISGTAPISVSAGVISHLAGDGQLHVPATGTTNNGEFLKAGATAGSIAWAPLVYADLTGTVPTWNQNTTGSAASLTTARTFTIGSTGKTFNGSANVSWTLAEIGAAPAFVSGAQNLVWATPAGAAGVPSLRILVALDIPGLDAAKIISGTFSTDHLGTGTGNASNWLRGDGAWTAITPAAIGAQAALSGGVSNTITKWTGAGSLGNSSLTDDGTTVTTSGNVRFVKSGPSLAYRNTAAATNEKVWLWSSAGGAHTLYTYDDAESVGSGVISFSRTGATATNLLINPAQVDITALNASGIVKAATGTGRLGIASAGDFPTLNQSTTGSAATLTIARTLTIGSTGKTFNGSANVSWTLAEIGAQAAGSYLPVNNPTFTGILQGPNASFNGTGSATIGAGPYIATQTVGGSAGWALQLGASNTWDLWNIISSTWTKQGYFLPGGNLVMNGAVTAGNAAMAGWSPAAGYAWFGANNQNQSTSGNSGFLQQNSSGHIYMCAPSGTQAEIQVNNATILSASSTGVTLSKALYFNDNAGAYIVGGRNTTGDPYFYVTSTGTPTAGIRLLTNNAGTGIVALSAAANGGITLASSLAWGGATIGSADWVVQGSTGAASNGVTGVNSMTTYRRSGFYQFDQPSDGPNGSNWTHVINSQGYAWGAGAQYTFQIASSFSGGSNLSWGPETYAMRVITSGTAQPWRYIWHNGLSSITFATNGGKIQNGVNQLDFHAATDPNYGLRLSYTASGTDVFCQRDLTANTVFARTSSVRADYAGAGWITASQKGAWSWASSGGVLPGLGVNEWCFLVCDETGPYNRQWTTNATQSVRIRTNNTTYTTASGGNLVNDGATMYVTRTTCILMGPTDSGSNACSLIAF